VKKDRKYRSAGRKNSASSGSGQARSSRLDWYARRRNTDAAAHAQISPIATTDRCRLQIEIAATANTEIE